MQGVIGVVGVKVLVVMGGLQALGVGVLNGALGVGSGDACLDGAGLGLGLAVAVGICVVIGLVGGVGFWVMCVLVGAIGALVNRLLALGVRLVQSLAGAFGALLAGWHGGLAAGDAGLAGVLVGVAGMAV